MITNQWIFATSIVALFLFFVVASWTYRKWTSNSETQSLMICWSFCIILIFINFIVISTGKPKEETKEQTKE